MTPATAPPAAESRPSPGHPAPAIPHGYWHARDALLARYGLDLGLADFRKLAGRVRAGHPLAVPLYRRAGGGMLHALWLGGRWIAGVCDEATGAAVTFLPDCTLAMYRDRLEQAARRGGVGTRRAAGEGARG